VFQRLFPTALVVCLLCFGAATAEARRVSCTDVLGQLDRMSDDADGKPPEAERVADLLQTDAAWVQRCANTYGRRVTMAAKNGEADAEGDEERLEGDEPEEIAPEEKKAAGDAYEGEVQDEKRRARRFGEDAHEWQPAMQKPWAAQTGDQCQPTLLDDDSP
jgi:hypothetical protein